LTEAFHVVDKLVWRHSGIIRRRGAARSPAADAFHARPVQAMSGGAAAAPAA
jgi:hypothetical protein